MCLTCGCDEGHQHSHSHTEGEGGERRRLSLERDLLAANARDAEAVRGILRRLGVLGLNLVSSPGAGKTTLLVQSIRALMERCPVAVIEGDQQTSHDADRIRATGASALQINTGRGCHLDAHSILHALEELSPEPESLLFIENVGNLVCPALFDLGEAHKVVILSTPEGDDKPIKYPHMFAAADLMILNKIDLLPYLPFDVERCLTYARRVNPRIDFIQLSASTGEGMESWIEWIQRERGVLQTIYGSPTP